MLPVTIIGGYLGAGKTTLVNHLLRHADGTKIAVLVNEFGALPIDADLIEAQDDALISIAGGCVCCSYGNDLVQAMLDLAKLENRPDHLVIESSGVALPGAIAATVGLMDGFVMEGVVVLADAETIRTRADDPYMGDTITRQLADAQLVLLTVTDWLGTQAPEAAVIEAQHARVPGAVVMQSFGDTAPPVDTAAAPHAPAFESAVLAMEQMCDATRVAQRLADPDIGLIRAKGFVQTQDGMRAVQVVGKRWRVTAAPEGAKPGVVIITRKTEKGIAGLVTQLQGELGA